MAVYGPRASQSGPAGRTSSRGPTTSGSSRLAGAKAASKSLGPSRTGASSGSSREASQALASVTADVHAASAELIEDILESLRTGGVLATEWQPDVAMRDEMVTLASKHAQDVVAAVRRVPGRRLSGGHGGERAEPADVVKLRNQIADARARTAAVRAQLSRAELEIAQATQRASAAEERFRRADSRASKAEARLKAAEEDPLILRWGDKEWSSPSRSPSPKLTGSRSRSPSPGKVKAGASGGGAAEGGAPPPDDWAALRDKAVKDAVDRERLNSKRQLEQLKQAHEAELRRHFSPQTADAAGTEKAVREAVEKERQAGRRRLEAQQQASDSKLKQIEETFDKERKTLQAQAMRGGSTKMSMMGGGDDAQKEYLKERRAMEKDLKAAKEKLETIRKDHEEELNAFKEKQAEEIKLAEERKAKELALDSEEKDKLLKELKKELKTVKGQFEDEKAKLLKELEDEKQARKDLEEQTSLLDAEKADIAKERQKIKDKLEKAKQKEHAAKEQQKELEAAAALEKAKLEEALKAATDEAAAQEKAKSAESQKALTEDPTKEEPVAAKEKTILGGTQATAAEKVEQELVVAEQEQKAAADKAAEELRLAREKAFAEKEQVAMVMAERSRRLYAEMLYKFVTDEWKKLADDAKIKKRQARASIQHQEQLDAIKLQASQDKQKAATLMAASLEKKNKDDLLQAVLLPWQQAAKEERLQREKQAAEEAHNQQLASLKAEAQKDKETAARHMAERNLKVHLDALLTVFFSEWHKHALYVKSERSRAEHKAELERMAQESIENTLKRNAKVAETLRNAHFLGLQRSLVASWHKLAALEAAKRQGLEDVNTQVEELRQRMVDDRVRYVMKMAADIESTRGESLLQSVFSGWQRAAIESTFAEAAKAAEMKFQEELLTLRGQVQSRGDAAKEQMAKTYHQNHLEQLLRTCVFHWHIHTVKENAVARRQSVFNKMADERRRMKEVAVIRMAADISKRQHVQLLQLYFSSWHKMVLQEKHARKRQSLIGRQEKEILKVQDTIREKITTTAARWAEDLWDSNILGLQQAVLTKWQKVASDQAGERRRLSIERRHVEVVGELRWQRQNQLTQMARRVAEDMWIVQSRALCALVLSEWRSHRLGAVRMREALDQELRYQGREKELAAEHQQFTQERMLRLAAKVWAQTNQNLLPVAFGDWLQSVTDSKTERRFQAIELQHQENVGALRGEARGWRLQFGQSLAVGNEKRAIWITARACLSEWRQVAKDELAKRKLSAHEQRLLQQAKDAREQEYQFRLKTAREIAGNIYIRESSHLAQVVVHTWRQFASDSRRQKILDEEIRKLDQEKRELRTRELDKAYLASEKSASQMRRIQNDALLHASLTAWQHSAERTARERSRRAELLDGEERRRIAAAQERSKMFLFARSVVDNQDERQQEFLKATVLAAWRSAVQDSWQERAWRDREEELRRRFEDDIAHLVATQATRVDSMSTQMMLAQISYEGQLTLLRAFLGWHTLSQRSQVQRTMKNVEVRQEDELALLVSVQVTERQRLRKDNGLLKVKYMLKDTLQRAHLAWYQGVQLQKLETEALQTKVQARTVSQMIANRSKEQVAQNLARIGEAITKKHFYSMQSRYFSLFRQGISAHRHSETRKQERQQHRDQLQELYSSMLARIEKTTVKLNSDLERVAMQAFLQSIMKQWLIVAAHSKAKREHNLALRDQRWEFEDKAKALEEKEFQKRVAYAQSSAQYLAKKVAAERVGVIFRTWREGQMRQRFADSVTRFYEEIRDIKTQHAATLDKATIKSRHILRVMSDLIYGVHDSALSHLALLMTFACWRRSYMVMPRLHQHLLHRQHVETVQECKDRLFAVSDLALRDKISRTMDKAFTHWLMAMVQDAAVRDMEAVKFETRVKVSDAVQECRKGFEHKVELFTRWLQQELRRGTEGKAFAVWSSRFHNRKQDQQLEAIHASQSMTILKLKGVMERFKAMVVPILAKTTRRTLLQRYFGAFRTLYALGQLDAAFKSRVDFFTERYDSMQTTLKQTMHRKVYDASFYVQEHQLKVNEYQQLAFAAMAWCETARSMHERRQNEAQMNRLEADLESKKSSLKRMEDNIWHFCGWLNEQGAVICGVRCLFAWRQLVVLHKSERKLVDTRQEADGRISVVRKKINAEKEASMERAYSVFERVNAVSCMQEMFWAWQRIKDETRASREKAEIELKAHREKTSMQREHREKVMTVQHTMQSRWQQANQSLEEMEEHTMLLRCLLVWAADTKVSRIGREAKKTADDYESVLKDTEDRAHAAEEARRLAEAQLALPSRTGGGRSTRQARAVAPPPQLPRGAQATLPGGEGLANAQLAWIQPAGTAELKLALVAPGSPKSGTAGEAVSSGPPPTLSTSPSPAVAETMQRLSLARHALSEAEGSPMATAAGDALAGQAGIGRPGPAVPEEMQSQLQGLQTYVDKAPPVVREL